MTKLKDKFVRLIILTCVPLFLFSCSSVDIRKNLEPIKINLKDLRPYSEALGRLEPFEAPYVSTFTKESLALDFVAADHVEGDQNSTCRTIEDLFKKAPPRFLLVEGWAFSEINDVEQIKVAQECEKNNYKGCGEDACAINLALAKKIPFNYAEPDDASIKNSVIQAGYTDRELLFFYGLRQIPQYIRQGIKDEKAIKHRLLQYLEHAGIRRLKIGTPVMSLEEFEKIFLSKLSRKVDYLKVDTELVSPRLDNGPEWSNRMSHQVGEVREHHIAKMIEARVNEYQHVIIVYGAGHLVKERAALEKAFGAVENFKLY